MSFNVSEFRAQMQGDGARPNLFEVSMPFPVTAVPGSANAQRKLTFMAKTTSLPGSTLGTTSLQYFGREIKLVGNRTFADWTITIINDEDFAVRTAFEAWMNAISSHAFNRRNSTLQSATSYTVDGKVTQYGKAGDVLRTYNMIGCFPTDLSPIDLDWSSNDTIEEFSVTLQYQWWESADKGIL